MNKHEPHITFANLAVNKAQYTDKDTDIRKGGLSRVPISNIHVYCILKIKIKHCWSKGFDLGQIVF